MLNQRIILFIFKHGAVTRRQLSKFLRGEGYTSPYRLKAAVAYLKQKQVINYVSVDGIDEMGDGCEILILSKNMLQKLWMAIRKDGDLSEIISSRIHAETSRLPYKAREPAALSSGQVVANYYPKWSSYDRMLECRDEVLDKLKTDASCLEAKKYKQNIKGVAA